MLNDLLLLLLYAIFIPYIDDVILSVDGAATILA